MHGPTQVDLLWILTILWKSSYCVWHWGRWLIPACESSARALRSQHLRGRDMAAPEQSPKCLNCPSSANFHKICKKISQNQIKMISIWDRKAKRQLWTKRFKLEYNVSTISCRTANAGKPWRMEQQFCAFYPSPLLCCSYQIDHLSTTIPARCLASSSQKRPSPRTNALLKTPSSSEELARVCWPSPQGNTSWGFQTVAVPPLWPRRRIPFTWLPPDEISPNWAKNASSLLLLIFFFCVLLADWHLLSC